MNAVYQSVKRLTLLAYAGNEDRVYDLMLIDALLEAMSAPVPDAHGVVRDVEVAMTGLEQNGRPAYDDIVRQSDGERDWNETVDRCDDCKMTLSTRGTRCDDCKGLRSEKFVLRGESDSPAEEN